MSATWHHELAVPALDAALALVCGIGLAVTDDVVLGLTGFAIFMLAVGALPARDLARAS